MRKEYTTAERNKLIEDILQSVQNSAKANKRILDAGDTLLALCFKSDKELNTLNRVTM